MKELKYILSISLLFVLFSCSTTKYVPEDQYLLDKVNIEIDTKDVSQSDIENYLQQKPNGNFLFLKKFSLKIYSLSGRDTTKRRNRLIRRIGEAPVIYSQRLTEESKNQLTQRMQNLGYLAAKVTYDTILKPQKAEVTYYVEANNPFTVRTYEIDIEDSVLIPLLESRRNRSLHLKPGDRFIPEKLDAQLQIATNSLRNRGYYNLAKENFYFLVDSSLNINEVDLKLKIRDQWLTQADSIRQNSAFKQYYINSVTIISGYDQFDPQSRINFSDPDTINYKGFKVIYGDKRFIKPSVLYYNCFIKPGRLYSDRILENTYSSLNSLSAVKQATVYFREVEHQDSALLDTYITIAPSNIFYWQTGIDGTNSAGDLGVAGYLTFQNRNIFNGSETFRIKLNGAIESISSGFLTNNFFQYGTEISLSFPRFLIPLIPERLKQQTNAGTTFTSGLNWQNRPEYNKRFVNLDWTYTWNTLRRRLNHVLNLYSINYIATPWKSDTFQTYLDREENLLLRESYKDQFITRTSYSVFYISRTAAQSPNNGYTIRASLDVAGTLPFLISQAAGNSKDENGFYHMFGIPFAQYFKTSFDITRLLELDRLNIIVLHAGLGVAHPYGNSLLIPYEQRFFAGGPNSVRGWSTRTLGPGAYQSQGKSDFLNQNGDMKILFNLEYRLKTNSFMEYAAFLDLGNVWTLKDYESQPGGQFDIKTFWKEMGLSWGIGIRPNFGFILIRLDLGMKIYNPEMLDSTKWVISSPRLRRDLALHFAIGYPF
jgi:outer membrane protein assembly factor BamA